MNLTFLPVAYFCVSALYINHVFQCFYFYIYAENYSILHHITNRLFKQECIIILSFNICIFAFVQIPQ